ncbi:hypothetical protein D9M72_544440 [compost metagenome]
MVVLRHKTSADSLDGMRRWASAAQDWRQFGLDGYDFQVRELFLQDFGYARDMSAGAHTRDDIIQSVRKIL